MAAGAIVELAGADGVVVHLREDRRHIQDRDVQILRQTVKTKLILEMAPTQEMISIALAIKPDLVTLVPEKCEELTTEGGLDIVAQKTVVSGAVQRLQGGGIPVSLFVDPDEYHVRTARELNADAVEIHTGTYCDAQSKEDRLETFEQIRKNVKLAYELELGINAGHGLGYETIKGFKGLSEIDEFSIGHSIIARAVLVGLDRAVREMMALVKEM